MALEEECFESVPLHIAIVTYINFALWYVVWVVREFINQTFLGDKIVTDKTGYVPLVSSFESLFRRNVMRQAGDLFDTPVCSTPGATFTLKNRVFNSSRKVLCTGTTSECLNMGSYNYLGFAQSSGPCAEAAEDVTKKYGVGVGSTRAEIGTLAVLGDLEALVARFLGAEDSVVFGMGFATNSLNLPTLMGKGCLVLSDEFNHASIVLGLRLSGATIRVFQHGSIAHLEQRLREAIVDGQPRINRPWRKILIVVEGVYSMEGSIVRLPEIIALKKKYNAYLYLDEAHSVGAMGPRGRGVVDYYGCDPREVDILMGTFTKSFGSAGGYIAGSKNLINYIRTTSHAGCYATSMSAPVAQQIISSMKIIMGEDGTDQGKQRLQSLSWNSKYFRTKLRQKGFIVYGHDDSPVVPLLMYMPAKLIYFVREMKRRGIATVGVGFPATKLCESRIRFCISSAHTQEMLDKVIAAVSDMGDILCLHYSRLPRPVGEVTYGPVTKKNGYIH